MKPTMPEPADRVKGHSVVRADGREVKSVDPIAGLLRDAIDESKWKHEAVAESIGLKGEHGATYFSKMLASEKPIGARHLLALPRPIATIFARRYAEHYGLIVVQPLYGEDAARSFVGGLFGILNQRSVPLKMARATVAPRKKKGLAA